MNYFVNNNVFQTLFRFLGEFKVYLYFFLFDIARTPFRFHLFYKTFFTITSITYLPFFLMSTLSIGNIGCPLYWSCNCFSVLSVDFGFGADFGAGCLVLVFAIIFLLKIINYQFKQTFTLLRCKPFLAFSYRVDKFVIKFVPLGECQRFSSHKLQLGRHVSYITWVFLTAIFCVVFYFFDSLFILLLKSGYS